MTTEWDNQTKPWKTPRHWQKERSISYRSGVDNMGMLQASHGRSSAGRTDGSTPEEACKARHPSAGDNQLDDWIPAGCPYCGQVMSARERDEQDACNDCYDDLWWNANAP